MTVVRSFKECIENAYQSALLEFPDSNPFLPGFIREYILSDALGHSLNPQKKGVDAWDEEGNNLEYKTFKIGGWGRFNVEVQHGFEKHLKGVTCWYFAEFDEPFGISRVWRVDIARVREFCAGFMTRTSKTVGHIMIDFSVKWIEQNGDVVNLKSRSSESSFIQNLRMAQDFAIRDFGVDDITLKGRIREIIIAEILGHRILTNSKMADALDEFDNQYEYLTSLNGKFQITHMTEDNLFRITRNEAIYCGQFSNPATLDSLWRVSVQDYMEKMSDRRPWPADRQNNFTVTIKWVKEVGERAYPIL